MNAETILGYTILAGLLSIVYGYLTGKNIFGKTCDLGYQDHISGSDKMNMVTPIMALSLGARYLEKHVTLDRSKKGVDY